MFKKLKSNYSSDIDKFLTNFDKSFFDCGKGAVTIKFLAVIF